MISVVMSAYNAEHTVARAVESVLRQTCADFEFLIADDGSTDTTAEILDGIAARDPRVRVIHQENRGLTKTLNALIAQARGAYIFRQDADDESVPERFARQLARLEKGYDFVCCRTRINGTRVCPGLIATIFYRRLLKSMNPFVHGTFAFRKALWRELKGYNEEFRYSQDYEFVARIVTARRYRIRFMRDVLYLSTKQETCISRQLLDQQEQYARRVRLYMNNSNCKRL
ncbi:MAG: glycosyltransferase [Pirellulales bacterium]|nr:glycosyltransferase [Pirellulales bacterium]